MATVKLIIPKPVPSDVVLTLTMEEAITLQTILVRIGGDAHQSKHRTNADSIRRVLHGVDVYPDEAVKTFKGHRSIHFYPYNYK